MSAVMLLSASASHAQWVEFSAQYEPDIFQQFSVMELGEGEFYDKLPLKYYTNFHSSYKKTEEPKNAYRKSKANLRTWTTEIFRKEPDKAKSINDTIKQRVKVESENAITRNMNLSIIAEEGKFKKAMRILKSNIKSVKDLGGSTDEYEYWLTVYNTLQGGFDYTKESYLTPGQRTKEYASLVRDVQHQNAKVLDAVVALRAAKEGRQLAKRMSSTPQMTLEQVKQRDASIARERRDYWRELYKVASFNGGRTGSDGIGSRRIGFMKKK